MTQLNPTQPAGKSSVESLPVDSDCWGNKLGSDYAPLIAHGETLKVLQAYALHRQMLGGSFIEAVLANNFVDAACNADMHNAQLFKLIAQYLFNHMPGECWGSEVRVRKWLANERLAEGE